jgi:branched-chain amino acid transport system substrate-binding protein
LLESEGVVGFCCGGSIVDCTANASYYAEHGAEVVPGIAACAEATTVHPVNVGPFLPILHMLDFFVNDLGHAEICVTAFDTGLTPIFLESFLPVWEAASGIKVNVVVADPGQDLAPIATKLRDDGCQAVMLAFTEFGYQSFFEVAAGQEILGEMAFGMLTSGYSLTLLDVSGQHMDGVYAASSFEPFTGPTSELSDEVRDYLGLMTEVGELPTGLGQGGYLAANIMIAALEGIEGEITFESVQEAIRAVNYETAMLGRPFAATGYANGTQPNQTTRIVQVKDGEFVSLGDDWHTFPRSTP